MSFTYTYLKLKKEQIKLKTIMKKIIMLVVCLTMMGIQSVKAQAAIAALHHEGNVTVYSSAQVAIDNSVNGDTVYLSEGMFGQFTISKGIAVIGSGMKTTVSPNIYIGNANNVNVSNLSVVGNIEFMEGTTTSNVKIRQCKIADGCYFLGNATDVEIAMCHIQVRIQPNPSSTDVLTVINSKIGDVRCGGKDYGSVVFVNCNIGRIDDNDGESRNNYVNCNIRTIGYGNYKNCLFFSSWCIPITSDCYHIENILLDDNLNCTWSDQQLKSAGCLGTDGTIVGITGGATPYTLASPVLRITDHNLEVDNEQRKLKVTLKLGTEE